MAKLSSETAKAIKEAPIFPLIASWLSEVITELDSLKGLDKLSNAEAGEEAKIRLLTVKTLKDILGPIMDYQDKWEPSAEELKQANSKYGI